MNLRLPLCTVLQSPVTPRHCVPHRTLHLSCSSPFVRYLCSNDTRLPQHPLLAVHPQPAEAYESYVGEDDWLPKEGGEEVDEACGVASLLCFDNEVQWVIDAIRDLDGDASGVVLCGSRVVADDCGWAVSSRTPALRTPREVFIVMRNSSKFMRDVYFQLREVGDADAGGKGDVMVTLAKALCECTANEFRVFIPYRLRVSAGAPKLSMWEGLAFAGVSQRATDVCFPSLMAWDSDTHATNYDVLMEHVQRAQLLERSLEVDEPLRSALLTYVTTGADKSVRCESESNRSCNDVVILAVDVLFESASLPIHIVSAKVRCFRHDGMRDPSCAAPFVLCEGDECDDSAANDDTSVVHSEESDMDGALEDDVGFFRLFSDIHNWNRHVELCCVGDGAAASARGDGDGKGTRKSRGRRFFVIASERGDLKQTRESLAKRGLPLEFLRPELLSGHRDFASHEWKEKLLKCITGAQVLEKLA
ncbi:hypothetical protein ERJ75_001169000 [Trypanosoma vivax]|nr:hypothetical protein ERJ75_001169000 [Trypanosoma vivax]